jgi:zinc transporter
MSRIRWIGFPSASPQSLDEIEEQVLSGEATDLRQKLGRLRRSCVRLHRQPSGLRIVFHRSQAFSA